MLHKPITSPRITSFISYMWIASLSQEHGTADTAHGILYMHIRTCALSQRGSVMFLFHIAAELTLRHQADVWEWRGGERKKTQKVYWQEIYYSEKRQREKNRERRRENVSSRRGIISVCGNYCSVGWKTQVVAGAAVPPATLWMRSRTSPTSSLDLPDGRVQRNSQVNTGDAK